MAQLAIKGHSTRGKEVIEILEMLGGTNKENCWGVFENRLYLINTFGDIEDRSLSDNSNYQIYTLEEFLKKFPYRVGDKVMTDDGDRANIVGMIWDYDINDIFYETQICNEVFKYPKELLQPYKEETMKEIKIDIPKGYEFAGVDDDNKQVVFTKIQPQYPKTYEECCEVLGVNPSFDIRMLEDEESTLYFNFIDIVRCRNAYWKIAGEQMGLEKPWKPDWDDENEFKYGLYHFRNGIMYDGSCINPTLLAFPTEKIRDAFYENFKDLINETKELL